MVKLNVVENSPNTTILPAPPSLTKSLMAGFDAVTNHLGLIFFTILLDLLLWFGPKIRLLSMVETFFNQLTSLPELKTAEMTESINFTRDFWVDFAGSFNLLSFLRAFPIGVPSLMVSRSPIETPLGMPLFYEINSIVAVLGLALLFILIGLLIGTVYFSLLSQAADTGEVSFIRTLHDLPWLAVQIFMLAILTFLLLLATVIPFSCIMSVVLISGLGFDWFGFVLFFMLAGLFLWLMLPLFYSPHGVFLKRLVLRESIRNSVRVTRSTLPTTGFLFLIFVILSEGLKLLWRVPPDNSWFVLIGILGHSFVAASLIATSFIFYKQADLWLQNERLNNTI